MVDVPVQVAAVEAMFAPFISVALSLGFNNSAVLQIYHAYVARMTDFINNLKGATPVVPARLTFENSICATYLPKNVPFKTGTLATSWTNTDAIQMPNSVIVRTYNFSMFVPTGATAGPWQLMTAPSVPTIEQATPILSKLYNYISSESVPHLRYTTKVDFEEEYKRDISGFGANATYYGQGNSSAGSPCKSSEWEVPVKAPMLSVLSSLQPGSERVGRHLKITGGDSTYVMGSALFPAFEPAIFKTKLNPTFCFLDLDEIVLWLQGWYAALLNQAQKSSGIQNSDGAPYDYFVQFPYSAQQFRIAVRQAILGSFVQTQAATQFITYTTDNRGFEPFRVGTNCYGVIKQTLAMPLLMIENLRMLMPRYYSQAGNFSRTHNQQLFVPVWGVYKGLARIPINQSAQLWEEGGLTSQPLFLTDITDDDPNVIDGYNTGGQCCNLNSAIVNEIIADWNDRIDQLQTFSSPTGFLGGSSNASLLLFSRYGHFKPDNEPIPLSQLSRLQRKLVPNCYIKKPVLTKTCSKSKLKTDTPQEEVYIPPDASLFTQYTDAYSSIGVITETSKQILNYFVVPTYAIEENDQIPTVRQLRTANMQGHILEYKKVGDALDLDTRGQKLLELGSRCAPGIANAGKSDELISVLQAFSDTSKGGFFGSLVGTLFPAIEPLTSYIPFLNEVPNTNNKKN